MRLFFLSGGGREGGRNCEAVRQLPSLGPEAAAEARTAIASIVVFTLALAVAAAAAAAAARDG